MQRFLLFTILVLGLLLAAQRTQHQHPFFAALSQQWQHYQGTLHEEKTYLHLDRTIFEPGEDIWFKAYLRNAYNHTTNTPSDFLHVELYNPRGQRIDERKILLQHGSAAGEFSLSPDLPGGRYTIKAFSHWQRNTKTLFEREIVIQRSVLPRLKLQLDFERKAHGPGDAVVVRFDAHSLTNAPLSNQDITYIIQIAGQVHATATATTDTHGRALLRTTLPIDLNTTDVLLAAQLPHQGRTESISRAVPVVLNHIDLQFLPEGGDALAGVSTKYGFKATNEFGKAAAVAGYIIDEQGQEMAKFSSFHQGMGTVNFTPQAGTQYTAKLTAPFGNEQSFPLPVAQAVGVQLSIQMYDDKQLKLRLNNRAYSGELLLTGMSQGKVLHQQLIHAFSNEVNIKIPIEDWPQGIATFTLYNTEGHALRERLVFLHPHQGLHIDISTQQTQCQTRQEVELDITVNDHNGKPVQGDFSLAVVDDNLLTFADDKQAHILADLLLTSELKGTIEEPNFYFDPSEPKAIAALDLLMLTHGWRRFGWQSSDTDQAVAQYQHTIEMADITGQVITPEGLALANARVYLVPYQALTFTNEQGQFNFQNIKLEKEADIYIANTKYQGHYRVRSYGHQVYPTYPTSYSWHQKDTQNSQLAQIKGLAYTYTDETLPFTAINLYRNGKHLLTSMSKEDGTFQFDNLLPGAYSAQASFLGYNNIGTLPQRLEAGDVYELGLRFHPIINLAEVELTAYKPPLIEQDNTTTGINSLSITTHRSKERRGQKRRNIPTPKENSSLVAADLSALASASRQEMDEVVISNPPLTAEPPPPPSPVMEKIANDIQIEEEVFADLNAEMKLDLQLPQNSSREIPLPPPPPPPPPPAVEEIFKISETMPRFPGCENQNLSASAAKKCADRRMLDFIYSNVHYPSIARENGVEGIAVISFVVEKDGSVTAPRIVRDIGAQCGQEALRIVQLMADQGIKWTPGKQRGRPVRVQFNLPVKFKLDGHYAKLLPIHPPHTTDRYRPTLQHYYQAREFYAPQYDTPDALADTTYDARTTLHWAPHVHTNEHGKAKVRFFTGDEITAYRITLEGFGQNGTVGHAISRIHTQAPLGLTAKWPAQLAINDTIVLPLTVSNHSTSDYCGKWQWGIPKALQVVGSLPDTICLSAGSYRNVDVTMVATAIAKNEKLDIKLQAGAYKSEWDNQLTIHPSGFPQTDLYNGQAMDQTFVVDIPAIAPHSLHASLNCYSSALDELVKGMDRMLRQPSGCFEQVSSSTYPNLLVLDLLRKQPQADPAIVAQAEQWLKMGYEKLISYEAPSGGFHWFGQDPGHEALTAYGILEFVDMQRVFPVDPVMIERVSQWLLDRRDGEGSWIESKEQLHSWQTGPGVRDAFIVWALCEAGMAKRIPKELDYAYQQAIGHEDNYNLALMINALVAAKDQRANSLVQKLPETQEKEGYWEGKSTSIVCSRGQALRVETTALSALAIMRSQGLSEPVKKAIHWLQSQRTATGFGHTQATVLALKAIQQYALLTDTPMQAGSLIVEIDGQEVARRFYSANDDSSINLTDLGRFLKVGKNTLRVRFANTKQALPFSLAVDYHTLQPPSDPSCPLRINSQLSTHSVALGNNVRLATNILNTTNTVAPAPMVHIGIPAGLSPQIWQLKKLMDEGIIDYYEIVNGYVICYFEQLSPNASRIIPLDLKADIAGQYLAPASQTYLYYGNAEKQWEAPISVQIRDKVGS